MGGEHAFGASLQEVYLAACETGGSYGPWSCSLGLVGLRDDGEDKGESAGRG